VTPTDRAALLEAARWAASSFNEQPWRLVYGDRHEDPAAHQRILDALLPGNQRWAARAPLLLVSCALRTFTATGHDNLHAWHDVGAAIAQLCVEATARGLVVHQMGGIDRAAVRHALAVPDEFDIVAGIAVGHPGDPADLEPDLAARQAAPRRRRPAEAIFFAGRFPA
jgi:nitroreductase